MRYLLEVFRALFSPPQSYISTSSLYEIRRRLGTEQSRWWEQ